MRRVHFWLEGPMVATCAAARTSVLLAALFLMGVSNAWAQAPAASGSPDALQQLNASVESLVTRVSRSVVQVLVTTYGPVTDRLGADLVIGRQRTAGSGVVVDIGGYVVTNAYVLANARRVEVVLPRVTDVATGNPLSTSADRRVQARIVGIAPEIDLALLKIEGQELLPLPMADYDSLRQGVLVFAFGSPEGLRDSVTMGVVSSVARQPAQDSPLVYVQTDAPINRGDSGGPLVNVKGELVGINTFILSDSGGNQGLGFAIPSALVQIGYPKLREYGHLHRGEIGIQLQTNTPLLAKGLGLSQDWGALIADVAPASPAEAAGLRVRDIIVSVDGHPVNSVPRVAFRLFTVIAGDAVRFGVLRGAERLTIDVKAIEREHNMDRLTVLVDPEKSVIPALGVLAIDLTKANARMAPILRIAAGVMVVGHTRGEADGAITGLRTGDTIRSINGTSVESVDQVRGILAALTPQSAVVLHVERNGQMMFLGFELE